MALKEYKEGEHPRFLGCRVSYYKNGKSVSRYYSYMVTEMGRKRPATLEEKILIKKKALEFDKSIQNKKMLVGKADIHYNTKSGAGTGVIGITFQLERRRNTLSCGQKKLYVMPVFAISISSCPTQSNSTSVSIGQFGLERAWRKSVEILCESRGFSKSKSKKLIGKCPSKTDFINFLKAEHEREAFSITELNLKRWRLSRYVSIEEITKGAG